MNSKKPHRKNGIYAQKMGNEWMLYDNEKGAVHVINATAEFIWRLCDGSNSIDKIKQELINAFDVSDEGGLNKDIDKILNKFDELGVLQD